MAKKTQKMMKSMKKKGIITGVHDSGSIWTLDISEGFKDGKPTGNTIQIHGDWRPMRDALDSLFDIGSNEFPYVSKKKIYENVIGQEIEYIPDEVFGASSFNKTGKKVISLKMNPETGEISGLTPQRL